jgi:hypothetical protein
MVGDVEGEGTSVFKKPRNMKLEVAIVLVSSRGCTLRLKCVVGRRRYKAYVLSTETHLIRFPSPWRLENLLRNLQSA